ncbi:MULTISPECIES: PfaD family polyunsaturated fatty acid/polyketide biosynthesis protein [unclassified Pseudoalteromonas]|uniref:PfaD family polyunsaturated fatty acid/polyketide biosynthesis protein n=1 Tax=unclassified Pseudoalteromonas TaxID=194690 RepID=UPI0025B51A60|nr:MULTISPECIES: PfaD family polyunsaturated fatty acid/polyketide biosynthesis protein [unclassified Pseudoalteromonas]MDN3379164.1 PfaD family polyunsaturated fatty acid/polyketide biosynthesis protein [Pseudoalteromonas sp. APC 3893]MDN3387659.1 PfaD family polyunsaturated fatty acid/polyketide biosynthesis protein [Pseudoalteromonas sp. APC 4017]
MLNAAQATESNQWWHRITAESLGSASFRNSYHIKYAYVAGAMYKGIASKEMVVALGKANLLGYLGTGGMSFEEISDSIDFIRSELSEGQSFGLNFLTNQGSDLETQLVDLYLRKSVRFIEASSFMQLTESIVRYRLSGVHIVNGRVVAPNKVMAKISRPEVAKMFMSPAPIKILNSLVAKGLLSEQEADLGKSLPVANELVVEGDSGGHTDRGVLLAQLPAILSLRDQLATQYGFQDSIHIGAAGGIGSPQSAVAAFFMGADFVMTGSINQCTVEADTSDAVKDILQGLDIQDTAHAPAGDLFELGSQVQVVRKGGFFATRANKLFELYAQYESIDDIPPVMLKQLEEKYFGRTIEQVWDETKQHILRTAPTGYDAISSNPKKKMLAIFKWYFFHSNRLARGGSQKEKVNYQIQCGPAMGVFNHWVRGTELEPWRNRFVSVIGERLMQGAAELVKAKVDQLARVC